MKKVKKQEIRAAVESQDNNIKVICRSRSLLDELRQLIDAEEWDYNNVFASSIEPNDVVMVDEPTWNDITKGEHTYPIPLILMLFKAEGYLEWNMQYIHTTNLKCSTFSQLGLPPGIEKVVKFYVAKNNGIWEDPSEEWNPQYLVVRDMISAENGSIFKKAFTLTAEGKTTLLNDRVLLKLALGQISELDLPKDGPLAYFNFYAGTSPVIIKKITRLGGRVVNQVGPDVVFIQHDLSKADYDYVRANGSIVLDNLWLEKVARSKKLQRVVRDQPPEVSGSLNNYPICFDVSCHAIVNESRLSNIQSTDAKTAERIYKDVFSDQLSNKFRSGICLLQILDGTHTDPCNLIHYVCKLPELEDVNFKVPHVVAISNDFLKTWILRLLEAHRGIPHDFAVGPFVVFWDGVTKLTNPSSQFSHDDVQDIYDPYQIVIFAMKHEPLRSRNISCTEQKKKEFLLLHNVETPEPPLPEQNTFAVLSAREDTEVPHSSTASTSVPVPGTSRNIVLPELDELGIISATQNNEDFDEMMDTDPPIIVKSNTSPVNEESNTDSTAPLMMAAITPAFLSTREKLPVCMDLRSHQLMLLDELRILLVGHYYKTCNKGSLELIQGVNSEASSPYAAVFIGEHNIEETICLVTFPNYCLLCTPSIPQEIEESMLELKTTLLEDIKSFFDEFEWSSVIISYPTRRRYSVLMKNAKGIETEVGSLGVVKYCDAYGCQPEFWKFSLTRNLVAITWELGRMEQGQTSHFLQYCKQHDYVNEGKAVSDRYPLCDLVDQGKCVSENCESKAMFVRIRFSWA